MENMFNGCSSLQYINMKNFDTPELTNTGSMFYSVPENVVVCINENNNNKIVTELKKKNV